MIFPETQQKSRDFSIKKSKVKFQDAFSFLPSAKMKMRAQLFFTPNGICRQVTTLKDPIHVLIYIEFVAYQPCLLERLNIKTRKFEKKTISP